MKRRGVRVVVALLIAAVAAAAIHQTLTRQREVDTARDRIATMVTAGGQADRALSELAAAERSYVAPGQGLDFWATKVDEALAAARAALTGIQSRAPDAASAAHAASAISRLDDFAEMDRRVREYTQNGQHTLASDLIFADGYEIVAAARTDAASAVSAAQEAISSTVGRERQISLAALAVLGGCTLLALLLLLRGSGERERAVTAAQSPAERVEPVTTTAAPAHDPIGEALDASLDHIEPASPALPVVNLSEAADVCVDLARLLDARDLQAVLARIAGVLAADGVIVWMVDGSGESLTPALSHGYAPAMMSRVGTLPLDADNATAAAWRAKSLQTVPGVGTHPGALAVPLLTSAGCTGVLALELRDGRERASDVQALARIVAAQLASSISPAEAESRRAAEASRSAEAG